MVSFLLGIDEFSQIHTVDHFSTHECTEATKASLQEAASFDSFSSQKHISYIFHGYISLFLFSCYVVL